MAKYSTYQNFQSRRTRRRIKRVLLALALVGLVVLCVWYIPDHLTYTEDGVVLDLPFLNWMTSPTDSPTPKTEPTPAHTFHVIIESTPTPPPTPSPTPVPTPSPTPPPKTVRALLVPFGALGDENRLQEIYTTASAVDVNTMVFEVKNEDGEVASEDTMAAALSYFDDLSLTKEALVSIGVDNARPFGPYSSWGLKHKPSGLNFIDRRSNRWLNLYMPEVRDSVAELCETLLARGFERVLLQNVAFPSDGATNTINYAPYEADMSRTMAIGLLLEQLRERFGSFETSPLDAIIYEQTASLGSFDAAGQDLEAFRDTFGNLFVMLPEDAGDPGVGLYPCISATDALAASKMDGSNEGWLLYDWNGVYNMEIS